MLKFILAMIVLVILFTLERLYIFPFSVPLHTKPIGKRSATYLAKTISRKAQCTNGVSVIEVVEYNGTYDYSCYIGSASFSIQVFLDKAKRDALIKTYQSEKIHSRCFKQGEYYVICENPSIEERKLSNNKFIYNGKMFYKDFPGEYINYTNKQNIPPYKYNIPNW